MNIKKMFIGCDYVGFFYKDSIKVLLEGRGIEVIDYGINFIELVDYLDFIYLVVDDVEKEKVDFGIIFCGSGNGVFMIVNKY